MDTPYVPHLFGEDALAKAKTISGWLTIGVVTSIPWPYDDVLVMYDGHYYLLRLIDDPQADKNGRIARCPNISTPSPNGKNNEGLARLYRFISVLGYFRKGFVDATEHHTWSPHGTMIVNSHNAQVYQSGKKSFECNYMPIISDDKARVALAFLREGGRLRYVHPAYSFLSYYKVIESQRVSRSPGSKKKAGRDKKPPLVDWINNNITKLTHFAAEKVKALQSQGTTDIGVYLYDTCRCAVAHADIPNRFFDPDDPVNKQRIANAVDIIAGLALLFVKQELGVPDDMDVYSTRDCTMPWHSFLSSSVLERLKAGNIISDIKDLGNLNGAQVSIRLWPDSAMSEFETMTLLAVGSGEGCIEFVAINKRKTIELWFVMDFVNGEMHARPTRGGWSPKPETTEKDVEQITRYGHRAIGNGTVELVISGTDPVQCETIIPVNVYLSGTEEEAVAGARAYFCNQKEVA